MGRTGVTVFLLWLAAGGTAAAGEGAALRAGAAVIDVTPPTGHPMWGYAARHAAPCTGVRDRLHARALVLDAGGTRVAFVGLDLGRAPPAASTDAVRKRVAAAGVREVFLVASHTHHGPVLELDDWPDPENPYARELEWKLARVILDAAKGLCPARVGMAGREVPLNRNRHSKRADPPRDGELLVLRVEDEAGRPIAHAVNFAAHPTMLPVKLHEFSADYPGRLCRVVEEQTGAPCLFLQGAAGDLSPNPPPEAAGDPDRFGEALAAEVLKLSRAARCERGERPVITCARERFTFRPRVDLSNVFLKATLANAFFPELIAFYEREYREGVRPELTVALLNQEVGFVGVSGELFCGHGLSLKRRARLKHVFVMGYCNDYHQYFPTIEAAAEGGYGADPPMAMAEVGAGERMTDRALVLLYRMRGKIPELNPAE